MTISPRQRRGCSSGPPFRGSSRPEAWGLRTSIKGCENKDGGRPAATIATGKPATRIFDTATGARLGTILGEISVLGLSGDGDEVLTSVYAEESVMGDKPEPVTYDMESGQVTGRTKVKLPAGDTDMIDWTGDTQVTLHLVRHLSNSCRMTIVQIDTETGTVKIRDRYTPLKDTFLLAARGG